MTMKDTITKPEVKFWMALFAVVIGIVIWGVKLESKVEAMDATMWDKGGDLRQDMEVGESAILKQLDKLELNQQRIMVRLGIEP